MKILTIFGSIIFLTLSGCLVYFLWLNTSSDSSPPSFSLKSSEKPSLSGEWEGGSWGSVIFHGMEGTYTGTFKSSKPGKIKLSQEEDGSYSGTWKENRKFHGTMTLSFKDPTTLNVKWKQLPPLPPKNKKKSKKNKKSMQEEDTLEEAPLDEDSMEEDPMEEEDKSWEEGSLSKEEKETSWKKIVY